MFRNSSSSMSFVLGEILSKARGKMFVLEKDQDKSLLADVSN